MFDTDAGHMCFLSIDPNRPQWKSETTPEERLSVTRALASRSARKRALYSDITRSIKTPTQSARLASGGTFQGTNRMSLRIDTPELNSPVVESTLIWERVVK